MFEDLDAKPSYLDDLTSPEASGPQKQAEQQPQ
jgi:hypothetical protein